MAEIYDPLEQSERVKGWLRENGGAIVMGLVLAFGGLFGFKQLQLWQANQRQQASAEYMRLVELLADDRMDDAMANFDSLREEFPDSSYATLAALQMARARVDSGQADIAIGLLETVLTKGEPAPVREIARARLARLKVDQGDAAGALALLAEARETTGFESRHAEIRGDAHLALGATDQALAEYQLALETQEPGTGYRPLLEMKIQALGGDPAASASNPDDPAGAGS